jgi:hypothetical protein
MNLFILVEHLAVGKQSRQIRHFLLFLGNDLEPGRPHISSVQFHHEWDAPNGALAQLGEHLLCKQGVIGSIPIRSTKTGAYRSLGSSPLAKHAPPDGSVAQVVRAHA